MNPAVLAALTPRPPHLAGARALWDIHPRNCYTDASPGTVNAGVGDGVQVWYAADRRFVWNQTASASRPVLRLDAARRYYLEFAGADDFMDYAGSLTGNPPRGLSWGFAAVTRTGSGSPIIIRGQTPENINIWGSFHDTAGALLYSHGRSAAGAVIGATTALSGTGKLVVSAASWDLSADTVDATTWNRPPAAQGTGATAAPTTNTNIRLGAANGGGGLMQMDLYGVALAGGLFGEAGSSAPWSADDRAAVVRWLKSLAPDGPYPPAT